MTEDELVSRHPRLWHAAEDGAWPSIVAHGLLSAEGLCDLHGLEGAGRDAVLSARRPRPVVLASSGGAPCVTVRDQGPMSDAALARCLDDGLTPARWYAVLNARAFLWPDRARLLKLLGARAYRGRAQVVVEFDTASVLAAHRERVRLSPINSGATIHVPSRRGLATFLPVGEYPYAERRRAGKVPLVEVTVEGGMTDALDHAVSAERRVGDEATPLWSRTTGGRVGRHCLNDVASRPL